VEEKNNDNDGIYMALADADEEIPEQVEDECEMWTTNEISMESDVWAENIYESLSDTTVDNIFDDVLTDFDDLGNSIDVESVGVDDESDEVMEEVESESLSEKLVIDDGEEAKTYMFAAITLAGTNSTVETELYDSGASCHMSPYRHKFINFISIKKKLLTAADGGHFKAVGKGDMHISMPNSRTMIMILLKDVLCALKMGATLVSIGKIDAAGYALLFYKNQLRIFSVMKGRKMLAQILIKGGLYHIEHRKGVDVAAAVIPEVVSIEKLHRLMCHIASEAAKALVEKGLVEDFKLNGSSKMLGVCAKVSPSRTPVQV
jgi:hypothetical protein